MFVGREAELKELRRVFDSDKFEFVVVFGRRRVGKTTLISKACEGYRTIFHLSSRTTVKKTLSDLSASAYEGLGEGVGLEFGSLDAFLDYILKKAMVENLIFVIDEFPFLVQSIGDAMGTLQRFIDLRLPKTKLKLVLSGSSVSFMEHQVLGNKSPLYGRRTAQIKLLPFALRETKALYGGTLVNTVLVQLITSGVPLYVSYFSSTKSFEEIIKQLFFHSNALLYNEPLNILNMEVNDPPVYFTILELLAHGANKQFELADKSGMSAPNVSYYLTLLQEIGLVAKKLPFGEKNKKKTIWYIRDGLFLFYFKHVHPYRVMIERGVIEGVVTKFSHTFSTSVCKPFEDICKDHLLTHADLPIIEIGSWWGTDPQSKSEEEIDIVAKTSDGDMVFGECKFTNEPIGTKEFHDLVRVSRNLESYSNRFYWFYSKSGFTTGMHAIAKDNHMVKLISLEDLFE